MYFLMCFFLFSCKCTQWKVNKKNAGVFLVSLVTAVAGSGLTKGIWIYILYAVIKRHVGNAHCGQKESRH